MALQSRRMALCLAAFSSRRKARPPHPRSSAPQHSTLQRAPMMGTAPSSLAGKPCLPSQAACTPQQHRFSPRVWKMMKCVQVREAREPASSQVQDLLLKTGPGGGPRLLTQGFGYMSPLEPTQVACKFPTHLLETRCKGRLKLWRWSDFSQLKLGLHL